MNRIVALAALLAVTGAACDEGDGRATGGDARVADAAADGATGGPDAGADAARDAAPADAGSADAALADAADATPADAAPDATPLPDLVITPTIAAAPPDPLAGGPESCPVYEEARCVEGRAQRCALYDPVGGAFVEEPDPLLRRVYLYDRWYDLYHSPDGQTGERTFRGATPGGLPEAEWGAPEHFLHYDGEGDSAIWTGAALNADAFRYAVTGTEADYRRMEAKVRALVTKFDVTGIPGYLARHHFLLLPPGGPTTDRHFTKYSELPGGNRDLPIAEADRGGLPAAYREGVPDANGDLVPGTPMWHGHPSIDQYTGPWTAFPVTYPLLRDEALKARMVEHLTCYLKRLRRVEIVNLQENPDLIGALTAFFGEGMLMRDPDDIDFFTLDRIVAYAHYGINRTNADTFDRTCPDSVQLEPALVIDAAAPTWLADIVRLARDLGEEDPPRDVQIDHIYIPSVRGGDASHLIHMAAVAWWLTGDDQYRAFLFRELLGDIRADEVMLTMQAFRSPDFCFKFYGDHITYGTHWQLATLLRDDPLGALVVRAMHEEMWEKALHDHLSAKFNLMYASTVGDTHGDVTRQAIAEAVAQLRAFGGNGGVQDAPRRTHTLDRQAVIDALPEGVTVRCPTEDERTRCEEGVRLFGIQLESREITRPCDGRPGECVMADGRCVDGIASHGLPADLRRYADFMWQRSPYDLGEAPPIEGFKQSPGRDLAEPYWMARYYGYLTDGEGQVLAWRDDGACE